MESTYVNGAVTRVDVVNSNNPSLRRLRYVGQWEGHKRIVHGSDETVIVYPTLRKPPKAVAGPPLPESCYGPSGAVRELDPKIAYYKAHYAHPAVCARLALECQFSKSPRTQEEETAILSAIGLAAVYESLAEKDYHQKHVDVDAANKELQAILKACLPPGATNPPHMPPSS